MPQMTMKPDGDIQQDVACELAWDTRLSPTEIGIQVKDGIVTLTGTVDSWAKLRAAQDAAHRVASVLDVANELVVKLPDSAQRTDTEIAQAVRRALESDVRVPDRQIRTTVSRGMLTMEGEVAHWSQRSDAERAVEHLAGVSRVINRVEVNPTELASVAKARAAVDSALERQAAREAGRIQLDASGDTVSVSGTVHSWREREAVIGAVRGTQGVQEVNDHLRIEPQR
jgi:osmotically-inducible protein OsmY